MPIWGVLAILSNLLLGLLTRGGHRGLYLLSVSVLILFVVFYNRLSKPISTGFKPKRQKREESSTMLESCRHRGIDQ